MKKFSLLIILVIMTGCIIVPAGGHRGYYDRGYYDGYGYGGYYRR